MGHLPKRILLPLLCLFMLGFPLRAVAADSAVAIKNGSGITAPQATAIAAMMTVVGGAIGAFLTGFFNSRVEQEKSIGTAQLERQKFETGLIVDALKTNSPLRAIPLLKFYGEAGLIPTYEKSITSLSTTNHLVFPINLDTDQSKAESFLSEDIIATCLKASEEYKANSSGFVRAVAAQYGLCLYGQANDIIDQTRSGGAWEPIPNGIAAAAKARAGWLVIGGLKGDEQKAPESHGQLVVVVDGPLAAGRYPTAFWGILGGTPGIRNTINWAWNSEDRDKITYAGMPLGIVAAK